MRNMLLASAALAGLSLGVPALAQTSPATSPSTGASQNSTTQQNMTAQQSNSSGATSASQSPTGARPGNVIGTGNSLPRSGQASNITRSDTRSTIAPQLPVPTVGPNAGPEQFLTVAQSALQRHRTGEAQEALERAETRALDRSTSPANAGTPDQSPMIQQINDARTALGHGDTARASQIISQALAGAGGNGASGSNGSMGSSGSMGGGAAAPGTTTKDGSSSM